MFSLPWQIRLLVNTSVVVVPIAFLGRNIDILTKIPERRNRITRRLTFERVNLKTPPFMSIEKAEEFYRSQGFESTN
jgi:hypothetical protein